VVERQSFSAAARDLHLAPKTVSKQIARLEQALGTTLFERNTRNLRITDEGRAIAERARVALGVLEEVQELATGGSRELSGIIRLTAPMPFGRKFVAPAIHDFCRLHPRVGFDLRLSDQVQDLYSGDLDLAIRMGELADSRLVARRVAGNRRVHVPVNALWLTNAMVQLFLIITLFSASTYLSLIYLATSMILVPYLWSAAYGFLLAVRGETYENALAERKKDLIIGSIALIYAIWLLYAGGLKYLLLSALLYAPGAILFAKAKRESGQQVFTSIEKVIFAAVVIGALVAAYGLYDGFLTL